MSLLSESVKWVLCIVFGIAFMYVSNRVVVYQEISWWACVEKCFIPVTSNLYNAKFHKKE